MEQLTILRTGLRKIRRNITKAILGIPTKQRRVIDAVENYRKLTAYRVQTTLETIPEEELMCGRKVIKRLLDK